MYSSCPIIVIIWTTIASVIYLVLSIPLSGSSSRDSLEHNTYRNSLTIVVYIPYENHQGPQALRFLRLLKLINEKYQPKIGYDNILLNARVQVLLSFPCSQMSSNRFIDAEFDGFVNKLQNLNAEVVYTCSSNTTEAFFSTVSDDFGVYQTRRDYMTDAIMTMTKSTSLFDVDDQCYLFVHFGLIMIQPPLANLVSMIRNGCFRSSAVDSDNPFFILTTNPNQAQEGTNNHEIMVVSKQALLAMIHQLNDMQSDLTYDQSFEELTEFSSVGFKSATVSFQNMIVNLKEIYGSAAEPNYFDAEDLYHLSSSNLMVQPPRFDEAQSIVCPTIILGAEISVTLFGQRYNAEGHCRTASYSLEPISDIVLRCIDGALDLLPNANACSIFSPPDDSGSIDVALSPGLLDFIELGSPYFIQKSKRWNTGLTIMLSGISRYPSLNAVKLSNAGVKFVELDNVAEIQSFYKDYDVAKRNPAIVYIDLLLNIADILNSLVEILEPLIAPINPTINSVAMIILGYRPEDTYHPSIQRHSIIFKSVYLQMFQRFGLVFSPASFSERCFLENGKRILVLTPAVGAQREKSRFSRVKHMLPSCLINYIFGDPLDVLQRGNVDVPLMHEQLISREHGHVHNLSPGMQIQEKGSEFIAVDNLLDDQILDLLDARLELLPSAVVGADSYFIPFSRDFEPRSLIEEIIYHHIAPHVVGPIEQAIADGFLGLEWWVQSRATSNPKEYHLDTAITWCRDNDINILTCPYCPGVGTVFYLNNIGGSTAVFNQSRTEFGLQPPVPKQIAISYPNKNRLLLFKGDKIHGVLGEDEYNNLDGIRRTLLINYWFNQSAGFTTTPTIRRDSQLIEYARDLSSAVENPKRVDWIPFVHIYLPRDLKSDFEDWKNQRFPQEYIRVLRSLDCPNSDYANNVCRSHAFANPMPGLLFHLATGFIEEYINSLPAKTAFDHWYRWVLEKETNILRMVTIGKFINESVSDTTSGDSD